MSPYIKISQLYRYLFSVGLVKNQRDLAQKAGINYTNLSAAFNGDVKYLTDGLFRKICNAFPILNLEYFLDNRGEMLTYEIKTEKEIVNICELNINQRIKKIKMDLCKGSNKRFAERLNESSTIVNNWVRNGYPIGQKPKEAIIKYFPEVNYEWLIYGTGEMLEQKKDTKIKTNKTDLIIEKLQKIIEQNSIIITLLRDKNY
ncbi:MAG: hypothetical protein FWD66_00885 [Paludibacter sp.]|nr:hypothetical protein [Paludibacter sp.]